MTARKARPDVGDVFQVPITECEAGFGQVMAKYKRAVLLMVVFSQKAEVDKLPSIDEIVSWPPLFISNSMDAKIWHGDWRIIGNRSPDLARFPLPKYKVNSGQQCA